MQMSAGATFAREYVDMLGSRPSDSDVVTAEAHLGGLDNPGRLEARSYISTLTQFRNKYEPVVVRIFSILKDESPDEETIRFFLDKFSQDGYNPDSLAYDIDAGVGPLPKVVEESCDALPSCTDDMLAFAKMWESAAGKKIDVYEFIRYYPLRPDANSVAGIVKAQDAALKLVDKIHFDYLGRRVSMDEFLDRYLTDHVRPDFEADVLGAVLGGDEYRSMMRKRMSAVHMSMFGVEIHSDDLEYVLAIARGRKLELYSEGVAEEIIKAHEGITEISELVNNVYNDVLNRDADAEEIRSCVVDFRCNADAAKAALERRLHGCLEFHDVLKSRIRESYEKSRGRPPKPSEVYSALARVLKDHKDNMRVALESISI